jgi:predicted nuclease of predicted toxin-antitoxin system
MKILLDMNLSPTWVDALAEEGIEAVHWSTIGQAAAKDNEIFDWARKNNFIIFTHDLDFGTMLAMTRASAPSVIQVRTQDVMPSSMGRSVISVLRTHAEILDQGALIVVDERRARVRILPI